MRYWFARDMDFAGLIKPFWKGIRFALIAVYHMSGWPIAWAMESSTLDVVIGLVEKEIV